MLEIHTYNHVTETGVVVVNACGARTLVVEGGRTEVQSLQLLQNKFKDSLGYRRLCLKKQNRAAEIAQQVKVLATTGLTT